MRPKSASTCVPQGTTCWTTVASNCLDSLPTVQSNVLSATDFDLIKTSSYLYLGLVQLLIHGLPLLEANPQSFHHFQTWLLDDGLTSTQPAFNYISSFLPSPPLSCLSGRLACLCERQSGELFGSTLPR